jgi:glucose/arabinose dehydrogenase
MSLRKFWKNANYSGRSNVQRRPNAYRLGCERLEERAVLTTLSTFTETPVATGLSSATAMEFSPDGKLFIAEQPGTLEVWNNGSRLQANFFQNTPLHARSEGERGLLGIAFDPNYATNRFVYVYYTTTAADAHNRVSRFTANASGDLALAGSESVVMNLDPHAATNHNGGAIHFGLDGKLYVAVGDDANQDNGTGVHNAQRLTTLHGKMLRMNTNGTAPADNPFVAQTTGKYQTIWALGLRNPFTFAFQPGTGKMFINDVGEGTWEEIDPGAKGANYGWRDAEGPFDQSAFPNFTEPFYAYNHNPNVTTPSGNVITGGAFYNPSTSSFPASYRGMYFFADFSGDWIYYVNPATGSVSKFADGLNGPVDLRVDAGGSLYYLSRGDGTVVKVTYKLTNHAPVLDASKSPTLSDVAQNSGAPSGAVGTLVSQLVDFKTPAGQLDNVSDVDAGAKLGIAVIGANTVNGRWFYSLNNGATWTLLGTVTDASARLLAADARLYFQPNAGFTGTIAAAITFRTWDQYGGKNGTLNKASVNGGTTTFSRASDTASIQVA